MTNDATNMVHQVPTAPEVERLQRPGPSSSRDGHEVCADIHVSLSVAEAVVRSRRQRVAEATSAESTVNLLRELRALGVVEAAPQLVAMVAIIDTAVDRLADAGAMSESEAWEQLRKEVVRKHCQSPDTWSG
ncbi:MAG TPA: hypothetical protein VFY84_09245 [Jiangellales bacterium]|nr:hypothetical protein [Jiangellales bacterium]